MTGSEGLVPAARRMPFVSIAARAKCLRIDDCGHKRTVGSGSITSRSLGVGHEHHALKIHDDEEQRRGDEAVVADERAKGIAERPDRPQPAAQEDGADRPARIAAARAMILRAPDRRGSPNATFTTDERPSGQALEMEFRTRAAFLEGGSRPKARRASL